MLRLGCLVALVALVGTTPGTAAPTVTGPAYVIDGDTLAIGAEHVRLWGGECPNLSRKRPLYRDN